MPTRPIPRRATRCCSAASTRRGALDDARCIDIADKVLVQRPGDFRSMQNRALAADMLAASRFRRHDYAAAADYARRG